MKVIDIFNISVLGFLCICVYGFVFMQATQYRSAQAQTGVYEDIQLEAKETAESTYLYQDARTPLRGELLSYLGESYLSLDPTAGRNQARYHNFVLQSFINEEAFLSATEPGDMVYVTFTNPTN